MIFYHFSSQSVLNIHCDRRQKISRVKMDLRFMHDFGTLDPLLMIALILCGYYTEESVLKIVTENDFKKIMEKISNKVIILRSLFDEHVLIFYH